MFVIQRCDKGMKELLKLLNLPSVMAKSTYYVEIYNAKEVGCDSMQDVTK